MIKKIIAVSLLAFTANFAPAAAYADPQPIFMNSVVAVKPTSEEEKMCMRHVRLTLGGTVYEISRMKNMRYTTVDGKDVTIADPHHPYNDCSVIDGGAVTSFATGFKKWTDFNIEAALPPADMKAAGEISTYAQNKSIIDEAVKSGAAVRIRDDSRKFPVGKASAMYLLPKDVNTTKNGEPVAVYCTPNPENEVTDPKTGEKPKIKTTVCSTKYIAPDGLVFGYTYLEREESDRVGLDLAIRKKFESYKVPQ